MITLTIQVNAAAPLGTLQRIRAGLNVGAPGPLRQGLNDAVDRYEDFIRRRFDRLSKGGGEWAPLAASTRRQKLSRGRQVITTSRIGPHLSVAAKGGGRILVETGKLRQSLEFSGSNHVRVSIPNGVRVGSKDPKLKYHQFGTSKMPARPVYVPPPPQTLRAMKEDLAVGVRKLLAQSAQGKVA